MIIILWIILWGYYIVMPTRKCKVGCRCGKHQHGGRTRPRPRPQPPTPVLAPVVTVPAVPNVPHMFGFDKIRDDAIKYALDPANKNVLEFIRMQEKVKPNQSRRDRFIKALEQIGKTGHLIMSHPLTGAIGTLITIAATGNKLAGALRPPQAGTGRRRRVTRKR